MSKKVLNFMDRFNKVRYYFALWLLLCVSWVIIEACFIHVVEWQNVFYYPEKEYEMLEKEIISADNIFDEEFKSRFEVELWDTYKDSNITRASISDEHVIIYVQVKNYNLPDQEITSLERSVRSTVDMILIDIISLLFIFALPTCFVTCILGMLFGLIHVILLNKVSKQGKHFIEE